MGYDIDLIVKEIIKKYNLTEDDALDIVDKLASMFGWSISVRRRRHVEEYLGRPVTRNEWQSITHSQRWIDIPKKYIDSDRHEIQNIVDSIIGDD